MAHALIIAPRYDTPTRITARWADRLASTLKDNGHEFTLKSGPEAVPAALLDLTGVDYLVFYGHGNSVSLGAQPSRRSVPGGTNLVDTTTISRLAGRPIYAVACEALNDLGSAYGSLFPNGTFVGYAGPFAFSAANRTDFEKAAGLGATLMLDGMPGWEVADKLREAWIGLAEAFLIGSLNNSPDAFMAGFAAFGNSQGVGAKP